VTRIAPLLAAVLWAASAFGQPAPAAPSPKAAQAPAPAARSAYDLGVSLREKGDFKGAVTALDRAIALDPGFADTFRQRGLALNSLERYREALADFDRAIQLNARDARFFNGRANVKRNLTDRDGALRDVTRAIELDPSYSNAWMTRGSLKYDAGDFSGALPDYTRGVELDPRSANAVYNRGSARAALGDSAGARADYARALELNIGEPFAGTARKQIASLGAAPADAGRPAAPAAGKPPTSPPAGTTASSRASGTSSGPAVDGVDVEKTVMPGDPLDPSKWPTGDVLWAPPKSAAPPVAAKSGPGRGAGAAITPAAFRIPARLEFNALSPLLYSSAVSVAKEGMRLLQGPLPADRQRKFDAKWAPYFDYPSPEIVDYLNKLNPPLARFLQARAGYNSAVQAFQKSLTAAGASDNVGDGQGAATAMAGARLQKTLMDGYYKVMAEAQAAIEALGPMPNPFEVRARRAKAYGDAVDAAKSMGPAKPPTRATGADYWVATVAQESDEPEGNSTQMNPTSISTWTHAPGEASGSITYSKYDPRGGGTYKSSRAGTATWTPLKRIIPVGSQAGYAYTIDVQCTRFQMDDPKAYEPATSSVTNSGTGCGTHIAIEAGAPWLSGTRTLTFEATRESPSKHATGTILFGSPLRSGGVYVFSIKLFVKTPGGLHKAVYAYQVQTLTPEQVAKAEALEAADTAQRTAALRDVDTRRAAAQGAAAAKAEAVAFQREMQGYFAKQRLRVEQELAATADPARRKELMSQLLAYDEHMHASDDNAATLETGEWQRTRTLYDAYTLQLMDQNASAEAATVREPENIANATQRQIELMPPELRAAVRQTWEHQVTSAVIMNRDTKTMRAVAAKVAEQVRAYWDGVSGREQDKAMVHNIITRSLEATEIGAGVALLGVGGVAAAGAGITGTALWGAETLLGAAYGGATGYVEGGVVEASRRSLQWAGAIGFAAAEGIDGYAETGEVSGAAKRAAAGLLVGKAAELGVKWAGGRVFGPGPTGQEAAQIAEFNKGMEAAKQLVKNSEQAEWQLAQALSKGAKQAEVDRLTKEAERRAAETNASWYAKFHLKNAGPSIAGNAFDQRITSVYDKTIPEFLAELKRRGYDTSTLQFKPMRNPSSAGSVSMDLDLALVEGTGITLTKAGQPVSRGRFHLDGQEAWDAVYKARTGQSAERSLLNVTTTKHNEAFTLKLLQKNVSWGSLTPGEIAQATDAVRYKVSDVPLPGLAKFVENARGLEKEMRTKFLPYLHDQIAWARTPAQAQALRKTEQYWTGIHGRFAEIGKHENQAMRVWQLQQDLKTATGGKTLWDIADTMGTFWEGLAKMTPAK